MPEPDAFLGGFVAGAVQKFPESKYLEPRPKPPSFVIFPESELEPETSGHKTRGKSRSQGRKAFLEPEPFKSIPAPHLCFWQCSAILAAYESSWSLGALSLPDELLANRCSLGLIVTVTGTGKA